MERNGETTICGVAEAGLAITAVAALFSIGQGQAQAKAQKKIYQQQAEVRRTENSLRSEDRARRLEREQAAIRNAYGAAGFDLSGTPTDVLANTAGEFAREQYMDDFNTRYQTGAYDAMAANSTYSYGPALFSLGAQGVNYAARYENRGGASKG